MRYAAISAAQTARVAMAIAAAVPSMVVFAPQASAGATNCDYGPGYVCLYKNSNYATGGIARYTGNDSNYSNNTFDYCYWNCGLNDSVSSIKNRGNSMNTRHYKHSVTTVPYFTLYRTNEIDLYGHSLNNELSRHKWVN